jgi:hypothetical protein
VYAWIWRKLPFGLPGKLGGSVVLVAAAVALLWYVVFPWATPLLPFDDVQVGTTTGQQTGPARQNPDVPPDDIPYDTSSNNPEPSPSR